MATITSGLRLKAPPETTHTGRRFADSRSAYKNCARYRSPLCTGRLRVTSSAGSRCRRRRGPRPRTSPVRELLREPRAGASSPGAPLAHARAPPRPHRLRPAPLLPPPHPEPEPPGRARVGRPGTARTPRLLLEGVGARARVAGAALAQALRRSGERDRVPWPRSDCTAESIGSSRPIRVPLRPNRGPLRPLT
jgi:hypothetical protein